MADKTANAGVNTWSPLRPKVMSTGGGANRAPLSPSLIRNPELDSWVRIDVGGTVTLFTGKVEIGQGLLTAIARIGADELDLSLERVRVAGLDTEHGPDELGTISSLSMSESGSAVRQAAAEARAHLLELAAAELDAPASALQVEDGVITGPRGETTDYWRLLGGGRFGIRVTGRVKPKRPDQRRIVGRRAPRIDLPEIVTGTPRFVHDLSLPGMLYGRVVKPPSRSATLRTIEESLARSLAGVVEVVRDGSFVGVIAEREEQAIKAADALGRSARWNEEPRHPPFHKLYEWLREQESLDFPVVDGTPVDEAVRPIEVPDGARQTLRATYTRPYTMHGSIGPAAAVAVWEADNVKVWCATQISWALRAQIAHALGKDVSQVRIIHVPGPGAYGHNGADDAAFDAVLLAQSVPGRPVSIQWSRADEHSWEAYGPPSVAELQASLDAHGRVVDWNHDTWSNTHNGRGWPGQTEGCWLVSSWYRDPPLQPFPPQPSLVYHMMLHRNADPLYSFPRRRIVKRFVPNTPIRTTTLRGLGAFINVFALESFMDEVAVAAGADPLEYRLSYLDDERAREVLLAAAKRAGWPKQGMGLAFAQFKNLQAYIAVVVEASVDDATAAVRLDRAVIAADVGEIVDPDGLENQLEGGFVQAASWTLHEKVTFDDTRITSVDWETYPILRFPEVPEIETILIDRPGMPFLGVAEAMAGPTPAAIANAVYAASGLRVRNLPLTPDRLRALAYEL